MDPRRLITVLILLMLATPAFGQFAGTLQPGGVLGNPSGFEAPAIDATVSQMLDKAIGATAGTIPIRGASSWGPGTNAAAITLASGHVVGNPTVVTGTGVDTALPSLLDLVFGTAPNQVLTRGASGWQSLPTLAPTLGSGDVYGNATAGTTGAADTTLPALFDRAFGSTTGSIILRTGSGWGVPSVGAGNIYGNPSASPGVGGITTLPAIMDRALGSTIGGVATRAAGGWTNSPLSGLAVTGITAGNGMSVSGSTGTVTVSTTETLVGVSSSPTITSANCGQHYYLAGGTFYTVTLGAATGFPSGCKITFTNVDGAKGKTQSISGLSLQFPVLWPGQTSEFTSNGGNWTQTRNPGRWQLPYGTFNINIDPVNGSDTLGVADGLGTGAEAFKSYGGAMNWAMDQFIWASSSNATKLTFLLCAGCTSTELVHFSPSGGGPGSVGGASITLDLNGGTLQNTSGDMLQCYFGAVISIRNGLIGASGNILSIQEGCTVVILDGVTFGTAGTAMIFVQPRSLVQLANDFTIVSNGQYFILNQGGGVVTGTVTATIGANISFSVATIMSQMGYINVGNVTWALAGHTVTGTKYNVQANGVIYGSAAIPGSGAGTNSSGGQPL